MKYLRITVFIAFILVLALFIIYEDYLDRRIDNTYPTISFDSDVIRLPVTATDKDLLTGVTAYDGKDGDITSRVIVESISNFSESGVCMVTYAVVDNDDHAEKESRELRYTDYRAPRFTFLSDMRFEVGSKFSVLDNIGATDLIDGDISDKVKLISSQVNPAVPGVYKCQAQVTNSKGDVSFLEFNVTIYEAQQADMDVQLTDYLVYLHVGDAFAPYDYYKGATLYGNELKDVKPRIVSGVSTKTAGMYKAYYYVDTADGVTGVAEICVVVED